MVHGLFLFLRGIQTSQACTPGLCNWTSPAPAGVPRQLWGSGAAAPISSGYDPVFAGPPGPGRGAAAGPDGAAVGSSRASHVGTSGAAVQLLQVQARRARPPEAAPHRRPWLSPTACSSRVSSPRLPPPGRPPDRAEPRRGGEERPPKENTKGPVRLPQGNGRTRHHFSRQRKLLQKKHRRLLRGKHRKYFL